MFLSRPRPRRVAALAAGAVGAVLLLAVPASAHVTVHSDDPTVGASDSVIAFRVPNEEDTATTTKLEVQFPADHPLLGVLVAPHAGWSSKVTTAKLNPPVKTDDGTVDSAVSLITWTADSPAAAIPVGGYTDFDVAVGSLPDGVSSLTFKALQTYSDGNIVRWIDQTVAGQDEPEHPAPTLTLTSAKGAAATPTTAPTGAAAAPAATAKSGSDSDGTARALGIAGIVVGAVGLGAGVALGRRRSTPPPAA